MKRERGWQAGREGERETDLEAEGEMKSRYLRAGIWPFAGTVIY